MRPSAEELAERRGQREAAPNRLQRQRRQVEGTESRIAELPIPRFGEPDHLPPGAADSDCPTVEEGSVLLGIRSFPRVLFEVGDPQTATLQRVSATTRSTVGSWSSTGSSK